MTPRSRTYRSRSDGAAQLAELAARANVEHHAYETTQAAVRRSGR